MDSKLHDLLQAAIEKTQSGELHWQPFGSESFRARIGPGNLHVQRVSTTDASSGDLVNTLRYSAQVSNVHGQVVAEAEATEGQNDTPLALLQGLFTAARTAGLGGYQVIDGMLQLLKPVPRPSVR